jgi:predicted alpha/beta-fold hydrolase
VAVANALSTLKDRADLVMTKSHGAGVTELAARLVETDLRELTGKLSRHALELGTYDDGSRVLIHPYDPPLLLAGTSGGGKSTLATALIEQLVKRGYQVCIVDPEGDYAEFSGATTLCDAKRSSTVREVLEVLDVPRHNAAVNLLGIALADRPAMAASLLSAVFELRSRSGHPHWIVLDETHHLFGAELDARGLPFPR